MKFRARFVANVIRFATQQGASSTQLLGIADHSFEELDNDTLEVDGAIYNAVVEEAVKLTGDSNFGLHLGDFLSLSAAGLITQIVQSSSNVLEALNYLVGYANLGCKSMPFQLDKKDDEWELSLNPLPIWRDQSPVAVRHTMDGMMMFTLREYHTLTHQKRNPVSIHFDYPKPKNALEYEDLFRCRVSFGKPRTIMFLNNRHVNERVITSDYHLLTVLVKHAESKLSEIRDEEGFVSVVKQSIINLVKPEFPNIEQVSSNLNISVRTLQRRLKEEGYTYKTVLEDLKKQFALDYLRNRNLTVKEIAYLLDYAEPSSFIRSFKRWTGQSPDKYRHTLIR
ncbi:MAG: AraC family transcriptional regulator ligand-binding domain-containing protein [Bacteroidota bacterium]